MSSILKNNAYNILGIDTSASERDILKRSKEILNRLKVDETPNYDLDIGLFRDFRTEDAVNDAIRRLQSPKKRIREYFFWFQIADGVDEQVLGQFKRKDYSKAIQIWQIASEGQSTKAFFYKKNLAILYCLVLSAEDNNEYLQSSLVLWKELIDSDKFWNSFSKVYKLHDEQTASEDNISDFKKQVVEYLADIYTELSQAHKNVDYISQFQKKFSVKGARIEKEVLAPAFMVINGAVEKLEKMEVSADGILDDLEKNTIKEQIGVIQAELNNLIDLGLYDDSQTRVIRDRAAIALRRFSIDINNNLNETEIALGIAKIAEEISGMESSKSKIQADLAILQGDLDYKAKEDKFNKIINPIVEEVKSGNSEKALEQINSLIYSNETDADLKALLQQFKQGIEERIVKHGKPIGTAPGMYTINGIGTKVYGDTLYFTVLYIPIFPIARYSLENHGNGSFSFFGKLKLHDWQKYWQYILIGIVAIWILIAMSNG